MPSISLNKRHLEELWSLCEMGPEPLKMVLAELAKSKEIFIELEELAFFLSKYLEKESAARLATHLLSIRRLADRYLISPDKALDVVEEELVEKGWDENKLRQWREIKPVLNSIASVEKIEVVTKASSLYYQRLYHIHDLSIVTEMKPIFNEIRDDVVAAIVENKFYLTYSDGGEEERNLVISISYDELRRLGMLAERAIAKTDALSGFLTKSKLRVRVYDKEHS
jgi:hypothetical protein